MLKYHSVVIAQATRSQRNVFSSYIDYAKTIGNIPHTSLIDVLHLYYNDPILHLSVHSFEGTNTLELMRIRGGIFQ